MNFDLTDEQVLLRDALAGFLQRRYQFDARRSAAAEQGWQPEVWTALATELGLFGASLPESEGGFGGGPVETMVIATEFGRALVMEPYIESVVVATALLRGISAADDLRAAVVSGESIVAPALYEEGARFSASRVTARFENGRISGSKAVVAGAPIATHLLASAIEGDQVGIFVLPAAGDGIDRRDYALIDGRPAADITFASAPAVRLGDPGDAMPRIEQAIDEGIAAVCAEAVGVIEAILERTVDYTRQREQFGVAIASFQALQHRMADMATLLERARSMSVMATLSLDLPPAERSRAVSAAKAFVSEALKSVGEAAIQLHGGIGTTEEIAVSHYFKRATALQSQFGTAAYHLKRMGAAEQI